MKKDYVTLSSLLIGERCKVKGLITDGLMRRRMLDLGLTTNTVVKSLFQSPSGDPVAYEIRGAVIALRRELASKVLVEIFE